MRDVRLETKLGFDRVRAAIQARCSTEYAAARVEGEELSTDGAEIHRRHLLADDNLVVLLTEFAEAFFEEVQIGLDILVVGTTTS